MKVKVVLITIFLVKIIVPDLFAEKKVLTLEQTTARAVEANRSVILAREKINFAKARLAETQSGFYPTINAQVKYQWISEVPGFDVTMKIPLPTFPPTEKTVTNSIKMGASDNWLASVTLQQNIFTWWRVTNSYILAKYSLETAEYEYQKVWNDVIYEVKNTFYYILLAQELVKTHRSSWDRAVEHKKNVESKFNVGNASKFDLLRAQVQVSNLEPAITQTQNMLELAKVKLKNLLTLDQEIELELLGELNYEPKEIDTKSVKQQAVQSRAELKIANLNKSITNKNLDLINSKNKPVITGLAGYQYQYPFYTRLEWISNWVVGLMINCQMFDGFSTPNQAKQSKIQSKQAELIENQLKEQIVVEITQAILKLEEAKKRILSQKENIGQAEEAYRIANISYSNGTITNQDVLDTQLALTMAKTNYFQAVYDYVVAEILLEKAKGTLK